MLHFKLLPLLLLLAAVALARLQPQTQQLGRCPQSLCWGETRDMEVSMLLNVTLSTHNCVQSQFATLEPNNISREERRQARHTDIVRHKLESTIREGGQFQSRHSQHTPRWRLWHIDYLVIVIQRGRPRHRWWGHVPSPAMSSSIMSYPLVN